MHVVFVTPYFYPKVGGLENYAFHIASGLQNMGWKVTVITSNHESNTDTHEQVAGLSVYRLGTHLKLSNTPVGFDWYTKLQKLFKELKPDLVNAHTPVPFISDLAIRAAKNVQIPAILTYQNDIFKDNGIFKIVNLFYSMLLGNGTLQLADNIIVSSGHYAKISQKIRPLAQKVTVIPPGVHVEGLSVKSPTRKYILFVGQLDDTHRHKGLEYLLEAMSLLPNDLSDIGLKVIGQGNDIPRYEQIAQQFGVEEKVSFEGFVTQPEMAKFYGDALCLCLPSVSQSEGFGMVILEAATQKTPSIGSNIGGIPFALLENKTGLLFEPRNSKDIAKSIEKLARNPQLVKMLGEAAYQRVITEFTWASEIKKTHQLFKAQAK